MSGCEQGVFLPPLDGMKVGQRAISSKEKKTKISEKIIANRALSHDVTAAILVFQDNETAAMLVYQSNPLGVELFSYVNT